MLFNLPWVFWLGILTLISLITTLILGPLSTKNYDLVIYHRIAAATTAILAITHIIFAVRFIWGV